MQPSENPKVLHFRIGTALALKYLSSFTLLIYDKRFATPKLYLSVTSATLLPHLVSGKLSGDSRCPGDLPQENTGRAQTKTLQHSISSGFTTGEHLQVPLMAQTINQGTKSW